MYFANFANDSRNLKNSAECRARCCMRGNNSKTLTRWKIKRTMKDIGNQKGNSQRNPKSIIKKRNRSKPGFWKTEQGYLKFVEKCSNSDKVLQFSKSTWKSTVTSNKSSVIVRCTSCNPTVDRTVLIHNSLIKILVVVAVITKNVIREGRRNGNIIVLKKFKRSARPTITNF